MIEEQDGDIVEITLRIDTTKSNENRLVFDMKTPLSVANTIQIFTNIVGLYKIGDLNEDARN